MKAACYFCNNDIPEGKVKRCSRCRLTIYCSKECQTASWKSGHRTICRPHPLFNAPDGTPMPKPEKFSNAWAEQQIEKRFDAWIQAWRGSFSQFAMMALDLPNHPCDRNMTHCMTLWVRVNEDPVARIRDFLIRKAGVRAIAELRREHSTLEDLLPAGSVDPTKVCYVVLLEDAQGRPRRAQYVQFEYGALEIWRHMPKDMYAGIPIDWSDVLKYVVDQSTPEETMVKLTSEV
ncbi:hypothetical protein PHLGIDRAFT_316181 [Phlebiopsis gigantea 11061_1 CR5-6]|uniref:MYND-type domain-containing protein n=1 Tax=Phlebiopsis gigantea (strain 11061_1 CR5-6) TaxID=745531 RepID=A0A0C3S2G8_PHLG1|nr:hypothetical protein PHLGIDRAFT_316181 [Phlebiopsis gigantea 11061_1 CR5-6]